MQDTVQYYTTSYDAMQYNTMQSRERHTSSTGKQYGQQTHSNYSPLKILSSKSCIRKSRFNSISKLATVKLSTRHIKLESDSRGYFSTGLEIFSSRSDGGNCDRPEILSSRSDIPSEFWHHDRSVSRPREHKRVREGQTTNRRRARLR